MSTFRIKKIDQGLPDEWIPRKNDDGIQIGDDVVAEDVNELSEGIISTQVELLKSNVYAPGSLLHTTEGIASRLKYLEETAGQATLQDVYANGNFISVQSGRPLLLGGNGEIKIDDIGNLTFSPSTMRVKGVGAAYLGFSKDSVSTYLSDLNISANTSGFNLNLNSGNELTFRDTYLSSPVSLSQYGETSLETVSQSIIGAINELKNSSFDYTLQAIYDQSSSGRIVTNSSNGPLRIENGSGNPLLSAMNILGILSVSGIARMESAEIGANTIINDTDGVISSSKIKTLDKIEAPLLKSNGSLSFEDNRLSLPLSELGVNSLSTSSQSIAGAINELKSSIDSVGGTASQFASEHNISNGMHRIITTQADLGQESTKRIVVKDSAGINRFSVNGLGEIIAEKLNLAGVNVQDAVGNLLDHMNGDGLDHSAVSGHINATNPHNVVGQLNGLIGNITVTGGTGISVAKSGNSLIVSSIANHTLQSVYDSMANGTLTLDTASSKNLYFRNSNQDIILSLADDWIKIRRDIQIESANNKIASQSNISLEAANDLTLTSTGGQVSILSDIGTVIDGVSFSDLSSSDLDPLLPSTVIGAINKVQNEEIFQIVNTFPDIIRRGTPLTRVRLKATDTGLTLVKPVADYHPANSSSDFFGKELNKNIFIALEDIFPNETGRVAKGGTFTGEIIPSGADIANWVGHNLYLSPMGFCDLQIEDPSLLVPGVSINFTLDSAGANKTFTGDTTLSDHSTGIFRVFTGGTPGENAENTIKDIVDCLNTQSYTQDGTPLNILALIDGVSSRGKIRISDNTLINGTSGTETTISITPGVNDPDTASVVLTATDDAASLTNDKFLVGETAEETAQYLANAINRTSKEYDSTALIREDFYSKSNNTNFADMPANYVASGHGFTAKVVGNIVYIERIRPGYFGNEAVLSASSGITTTNPSGGILRVRFYSQDRSRTSITNTSSDYNIINVSGLYYHSLFENDYIEEASVLDNHRFLYRFQEKTRIGEVLNGSATTAQVFINMN